jgi:hypothetical protein
MKITEILVESHQMDEGPLLNKIGAGIGKAAGTVAKGIGAVAGGVVGAGKALAKGYQAGKATVGAAGDDAEADPAAGGAAPATSGAPTQAAAGGAPAAAKKAPTAPAAAGGSAPAAAGGSAPAAGSAPKTTAPAAGGSAPAAGGTVYAQIKANLDKLDKKGKQRILATLQKEIGAAPAAPAKTPAADPAAGAMGAMAGQLAKGGSAKPNTMANAPVSKTNTAKPGNPNAATPAAEPEAPAAGGGAFKQMAQGLGKKPAAEPAAAEPNYNTQTGVASPAQMKKNSEAGKAEAPYGFDIKTGKPNPKPAAEPGATTTTPSGEKVLANPVATVGTKRATNIGEPTFDKETGKPLPGQSINAIRKQAEYGSNSLGKIRKGMKAKAAAPAAQESIDADRRNIMGTSRPTKVREKVSESFSLFRKR